MDGWCDSNEKYNSINQCFGTMRDDRNRLYWRTVTHALCVVHHGFIGVYVCLLDFEQNENPIFIDMYKYRVAFLTGWCMLFQGIFLLLSLTYYDIMEWKDKHLGECGTRLRYWRDILYGGLVVPLTLFVSGIFWGTYAVDRQLIFPAVYEEMLSWWLNFCVHGNTNIILVLETLLEERRTPANRSLELFLCVFVSNGYAVMMFCIYFIDGVWLYQFYRVMNCWQICLHQLVSSTSFIVFYVIQYPIHRLVHDRRGENQEKDH